MVRSRCCVYPARRPRRNTRITHATTGWMMRSTTLQTLSRRLRSGTTRGMVRTSPTMRNRRRRKRAPDHAAANDGGQEEAHGDPAPVQQLVHQSSSKHEDQHRGNGAEIEHARRGETGCGANRSRYGSVTAHRSSHALPRPAERTSPGRCAPRAIEHRR